MTASIVYSYQLRYNLLSINKSVMKLLHVINLSEVNAYVHLTNTVLSHSSYVTPLYNSPPGINLIRGQIQSWLGGKERTREDQNLLGGIAVFWGYSEIFVPPPKELCGGN